jgi:hypothetical protein
MMPTTAVAGPAPAWAMPILHRAVAITAPAVAMPVEARSEHSMWSEHSRRQKKKMTPAEVELETVEAVGGGADEMDVVASVIPHTIDVEQMLMAPGPTSRLRKKTSLGGARTIEV